MRLSRILGTVAKRITTFAKVVETMNHWIETDKGEWLNLAHAQSVQELPKQLPYGTYPIAITMADGKRHTANSDCDVAIDLHALLAPLIPAAPGLEAIKLWAKSADGGDNGRPDAIEVLRLPIVGWRQERRGIDLTVVPIVPGDEDRYGVVYVLLPGNRIHDPHDCGLCTLEEFCAQYLSNAQSTWDACHAAAA
jgi:hypothetical protein